MYTAKRISSVGLWHSFLTVFFLFSLSLVCGVKADESVKRRKIPSWNDVLVVLHLLVAGGRRFSP